MKKQNQFMLIAALLIAAPFAHAGEVQMIKTHEEISFNSIISQNDAEMNALHFEMARQPESTEEATDANVDAAPADVDTTSN